MLCQLLHADQGDIVGREYIISSKFMPPYGILLADSTIVTFKDEFNFILYDQTWALIMWSLVLVSKLVTTI
jgi:hypothetical protein